MGLRVLFLGAADRLEPWYSDVVSAVSPRHEIALFDPDRPEGSQFVGVDVVVDQGGSQGTHSMMERARDEGVQLWQVLGTGLDHVDIDHLLGLGLRVANTPGAFSGPALAEHALYMMLHFAKRHREAQKNIRSGIFYQPMSTELGGQTLLLVGLGASGRELARRARAFGMRLLALDAVEASPADLADLGIDEFGGPEDLKRLAADADYLSVHVPLIASTRHMIDQAVIEVMKPSAVIVNVARGPIIDEAALLEAVRSGRIAGAGLDAFDREPLPADDPLLHTEGVLATPHLAGMTDGTSRRRAGAVADNIDRIAAGDPPLFEVTIHE